MKPILLILTLLISILSMGQSISINGDTGEMTTDTSTKIQVYIPNKKDSVSNLLTQELMKQDSIDEENRIQKNGRKLMLVGIGLMTSVAFLPSPLTIPVGLVGLGMAIVGMVRGKCFFTYLPYGYYYSGPSPHNPFIGGYYFPSY